MALTQVDGGLIETGGITPTQLDTQAQYTGFKNRIINGAMQIDQRSNGSSVTIGPSLGGFVYTLDRWAGFASSTRTFTVQRSATAPAGYINSALLTVGVSGSPSAAEQIFFSQNIEGLNLADLGWGTANAQTVAISFWIRSSIAGTYGFGINNSNGSRCYPTTYTINSANTWEYKTIIIAGDTSGTWLTTNGTGLNLRFDLGSGSNYNGTADAWTGSFVWRTSGCINWIVNAGATLNITGVQLEKGSTATSFDYRPYGTELSLCQRYCLVDGDSGGAYSYVKFGIGYVNLSSSIQMQRHFPVSMRANPSVATTTVANFQITTGAVNSNLTGINIDSTTTNIMSLSVTGGTGLTVGQGAVLQANANTTARITYSAEL